MPQGRHEAERAFAAENERARNVDLLLMRELEESELAALVRRVTTLKQQSDVYAQ